MSRPITLAEAFEETRLTAVANQRAEGTLRVLDETKRVFFRVYGPDVPLTAPLDDKLRTLKVDYAKQKKHPNTINRALRCFKRVCRVNGLAPKIEMMKVPRKKVDALTAEEIEQLLDRAGRLYPVVLFALDTGARRTEIATLEWENVDLERRRVPLKDAKSGDDRVVPLTARLVEALKDLPSGRYVFRARPHADKPYDPNALSRAFRYVYTRAGLREFKANGKGARRSMHTLRKSSATRASAKGIPLKTAMAIGGWKQTSTMLNYYVDVSEESMEEAIDKLAKG